MAAGAVGVRANSPEEDEQRTEGNGKDSCLVAHASGSQGMSTGWVSRGIRTLEAMIGRFGGMLAWEATA